MLIIITEKEIAAVQFLNTGEGIAKTQDPFDGERVITTKQSSVYCCYCGAKAAPDYDAKEKQKRYKKMLT